MTMVERTFLIFPKDSNHLFPMVFGGSLMSEIDIASALCVKKWLKDNGSHINDAVTHKADFQFLKPTYVGDTLLITARIESVGKKSVVVKVNVFKENTLIASAELVFVTFIKEGDEILYCHHGIENT